jgi:predicted 3-demethylubiquinone-9 3-methyltransferase (glyoxalase superfamily)
MQKITPFLWYDKNLKEIISYYQSIFPDLKILSGGALSDTPSGDVEMATIEILGQRLSLMTAGPMFKFNEAISFVINCKDQAEIDYYWDSLTSNGGAESMCGWCKDKYGLSWQIVPGDMEEMMSSGDKDAIVRVTAAFLQMKKFDIATLRTSYGVHLHNLVFFKSIKNILLLLCWCKLHFISPV